MTLLQLLLALVSGPARTDSERMAHVIAWHYRGQPSLTLVCTNDRTEEELPRDADTQHDL